MKSPSPSALVLSHVSFEDTGTLGRLLETRGFRIQPIEPGLSAGAVPDPKAPDLVVVLGGPIGVYEEARFPFLKQEIDFVERRLSSKKPIVGICLGAQLIAKALGARVYPSKTTEIGWFPLHLTDAGRDSPLALLGDGAPMLHWHEDTFDLPEGTSNLAWSDRVSHQAFMVDQSALALQFHPEIRGESLERWLIGHAFELASRNIDLSILRRQTKEYAMDLERRAEAFFSRWLSDAGLL